MNMQNIPIFGANVDVQIELDTGGRQDTVKSKYEQDSFPIFFDGDSLCGSVHANINKSRNLKHRGIYIELCGIIEGSTERLIREEFLCLKQDLARPGILSGKNEYPFQFTNASFLFESYDGNTIRVKYFLRVTVERRVLSVTKEREITVYRPVPQNKIAKTRGWMRKIRLNSVKFYLIYNKRKCRLDDVIVGKVIFKRVGLKVKNMTLKVYRKERFHIVSVGNRFYEKTMEIGIYEIMDGEPVFGDRIPFRLFLNNYALSPTIKACFSYGEYSVEYYITVIIRDNMNEEQKYMLEIELYRDEQLYHGTSQPCTNDTLRLMECNPNTAEVQPSGMQPANNNPIPEVHSRIDSKVVTDEIDRRSAGDANKPDDLDGGMTHDVLAAAGVEEMHQKEEVDLQTSETAFQAAGILTAIGKDSREVDTGLGPSEVRDEEARIGSSKGWHREDISVRAEESQ